MKTRSSFKRLAGCILAFGIATSASAVDMHGIQRNSDDPDSVDIIKTLIPVYEQLSKAGRFSIGQVSVGWVAGRPNPELATDDICGCHYLSSGRVINPDQCSPIGATGSEDLARIGVIRVVGYDRLRRATIPGEGSEQSRMNSLSGVERARVEMRLKTILGDPHLAIFSPLPVSDRVRHLEIGKVTGDSKIWEHCSIRMNDRSFSPPPQLNGFVARAMLYAATKYNVTVDFPLGQLKRLSDQFPPSQWEIDRNALILKTVRIYGLNPHIVGVASASFRPIGQKAH